MSNKYLINYNTGVGNFEFEGTLEEAMKAAEEEISYTQHNVSIEFNGKQIAYLPWWGTKPEEDEIVTCQFGDFGYYGEWVVE